MYFPSLQEFPLAVIRGQECHCGYPTERFPLHEGADGQLCSEVRSEGKYCLVYQTPVQGTAPAPRARARPTTAANGPRAPATVGKSHQGYSRLSYNGWCHPTGRNLGNSPYPNPTVVLLDRHFPSSQ